MAFLSTAASSPSGVNLFETPEAARAWLEDTNEKREEVRKEINESRAMGVSGVPFFVIGFEKGRVSAHE